MKRTILAAVLLAGTALATPASADAVLTLTPVVGDTLGPQSTSNPCIIAGTTCQQPAGFGYNLYSPNNSSSYNRYSTQDAGSGVNVAENTQGIPYNALALAIAAGGVQFDIAIDVNTTSAQSETLLLFEVIDTTTNTTLYHYTGPTVIGTGAQNGNGFGDFLLSHINLVTAGVSATDGILFHASWNGAVDGTESFFIVNGTGGTTFSVNPVPGPIAGAGIPGLIAACCGMFGLNWRRRRKNRGLA